MGFNPLYSLSQQDHAAVQTIINHQFETWNHSACVGFADGYTEDADFVNIFGMHLKGKAEVEDRHQKILQTLYKDSFFEPLDIKLREVNPGLVIGIVKWRLHGFRSRDPKTWDKPGEVREGVFTHVFVKLENEWKLTASQNTVIPK